MTTAEEYKAKGNAALRSGDLSLAVDMYTLAIESDGANHVYYSNRSAAHLKRGDANSALEDADSCVALDPDFAKGYGRRGAALHALGRLNDAAAAYEGGLGRFPGDGGLRSGLDSVRRERGGRTNRGGGGMGGADPTADMFGPRMVAQIAMDPNLRGYLKDDDFVAKIKRLQSDPKSIGAMLSDPRIMEVFRAVLGARGVDLRTPEDTEGESDGRGGGKGGGPTSPAAEAGDGEKKEPEPMEVEEEEEEEDDDGDGDGGADLSPEERRRREDAKAAVAAKERGNALYKSKKFEDALAAYDEAIDLDPTNMTFLSNKAAVYFTAKMYDECIEACREAVEVGKANRAPFEDRARALTRAARAHQKRGDLASAIEACREAQLESYDKGTERLLKTLELEKRKADTLAYQDEGKAQEAKLRGNDHFRNKEWGDAVREYEEAVKRAPRNAAVRNNLSAALCKIMDFNGAKAHIEAAVEIDPKYVKAWARKGDIEVMMKENHRAMDSYRRGLELDPANAPCRDGLRKVTAMINYGSADVTEEERRERAAHAMADPEIQAILTDPVVQQVLRDFQENPDAARRAMRDPHMRGKIERLIASGVVQAG